MKKPKPYKVPLTWWVGWIVLLPFRLVLCLFVATVYSANPTLFFGAVNCKQTGIEKDQTKWSL